MQFLNFLSLWKTLATSTNLMLLLYVIFLCLSSLNSCLASKLHYLFTTFYKSNCNFLQTVNFPQFEFQILKIEIITLQFAHQFYRPTFYF